MSAVRSRFPAVLAAFAAGALLMSSGPPALAAPATAAPRAARSAQLEAVAAVSRSDAWAVGTVIEHWNGRRWSLVRGARSRRCPVFLYGVAARSASLAWAVGYCGQAGSHTPVIERWNGRRWSVQRSPGTPASAVSELNGVTATSAHNAWAVGEYKSKGHSFPLIEHWNGRAWRRQGSPDPGPRGVALEGVTALSATSAWAVGSALGTSILQSKSLIDHWNGHSWRLQTADSPGTENILFGVTALSRTRAWAAGAYVFGPSNLGTLVEAWDGTLWQEQATPGPDLHSYLLAIAARSPSDAWTVGARASVGHPRTNIQHWNGTNWKVVPSPSPSSQSLLQGVAAVSGKLAWAVGYQGHFRTLIERWNGTSWKVQPSPS